MRFAGLLSTLLLLFQSKRTYQTNNMDATALSSAIAKFSLQFCNELDKSKSVVASPLSAEILLALLTLGTTEPAHSELLTSLGIPDEQSIRSSFSEVTSKWKSIKGVTLNVANKVYLKSGGYDLLPEMKKDAIEVFDAGFETVNFSDGAAAAKLINNWVESKTNNRIKDLLSSDSCNEDTRLVLVNALYFKGTWKYPFPAHNTMDKTFHVSKESTIQVPMMYVEKEFKYGQSEKLQAQLLEMPYSGGEASMVIVLPNDVDGIDGLLKNLSGGVDLIQEIQQMYNTKVQVTLPKFKIETEIDLNALLPKLGIKSIFNRGNSGLTKLLNTPEDLYVSKAVQKAFIEVNEEGSEAAAATGMVVMMRCALPPSPRFVADRPFLYLLVSQRNTLFVGVYNGRS